MDTCPTIQVRNNIQCAVMICAVVLAAERPVEIRSALRLVVYCAASSASFAYSCHLAVIPLIWFVIQPDPLALDLHRVKTGGVLMGWRVAHTSGQLQVSTESNLIGRDVMELPTPPISVFIHVFFLFCFNVDVEGRGKGWCGSRKSWEVGSCVRRILILGV